MAYFYCGTEGIRFDDQCALCRFGHRMVDKPDHDSNPEWMCPIRQVQYKYNYDAVKIPVATAILDTLVRDDGTCTLFQRFPDELGNQDWRDTQTGQAHLFNLEECDDRQTPA